MAVTSKGDFPLSSAWLGRGRGRGKIHLLYRPVNIYQVDETQKVVFNDFFFEPVGPVATGSLLASETGSDTFTGTGSLGALPVTGSMAVSDSGSDTFTASGAVPVGGTFAAAETSSDSAAFAGSVAITGLLAAIEAGADTFACTGSVPVFSVMAAIEAGFDTCNFTGSISVSGTLSVGELGSDIAAISGLVEASGVAGTLSAQEVGYDTFYAANDNQPTHQITNGSTIRPRRKFKPAILFEFDEEEPEPLPVINAALSAFERKNDGAYANGHVEVKGKSAVGEVGRDGAYATGEVYWIYADPTDQELALLAEVLFA